MLREHYVKTNSPILGISKYLLLTEFGRRTVSYGPRFPPSIYDPNAERTEGFKSKGKSEDQ